MRSTDPNRMKPLPTVTSIEIEVKVALQAHGIQAVYVLGDWLHEKINSFVADQFVLNHSSLNLLVKLVRCARTPELNAASLTGDLIGVHWMESHFGFGANRTEKRWQINVRIVAVLLVERFKCPAEKNNYFLGLTEPLSSYHCKISDSISA